MGSESNGFGQQRSSANTSGLRVVGFFPRVRSFINKNNKENSQVFTDATISVPSESNGFPQQHSATEDRYLHSNEIKESFNNLQNGSQDFTRATVESFGIGDSFNNHGPGSQVFKDALIRCVYRTSGIINSFNYAGHWIASLLPESVTRSGILISFQNSAEFIASLLPESVPHSGIRHSFINTGSQNLDHASIIVNG